MKNKIVKLLQNTWGLLIFALVSGLAYFAVIMKFITQFSEKNALLGFFFSPLIICGAALVLVKIIKQCMEGGNEDKAVTIFWAHIVFMIIAAVIAVSIFV